jgi:hypothetical protein
MPSTLTLRGLKVNFSPRPAPPGPPPLSLLKPFSVGFIPQRGTTRVAPLRGELNSQTFSSRTGQARGLP